MAKLIVKITERPLLIIAFIWLLIQTGLFIRLGFQFDLEGTKYIEDAELFLNSQSLNPSRLFYSFFPLIISFFIKIGLGLNGVIVFQLLLNAFSTFIIYIIGKKLYKSDLVALVTTLLFVLSYLIQQWNFYLFTESIFISMSIVLYYLAINFKSQKIVHYLYLALIFILMSFLRPNGILLIIPLLYFMLSIKSNLGFKVNLIPLFSFVFLIGVNILFNQGNFEYHISLSNKYYWIIWGYYDLIIENFDGSFIDYIKLFSTRFWVYFTDWRPYFSLSHNVMVMIVLIPTYILAIIGLKDFYKENKKLFIFIFLLIATFSGFTIVTFVNWHGRFLAVIIPAFIIIAGYGVKRILNFMKLINTENL